MLARNELSSVSRLAPALLALSVVSCGGAAQQTVSLLSAPGIPSVAAPAADVALEVVTHNTAVSDPLSVAGTRFAYADLAPALTRTLSLATLPWAEAHKSARPGGLQLVVEVLEAKAEFDGSRLMVTLTTRATLRARSTQEYVAQTQASCREAGLSDPAHGAPVIYGCMTHLGLDLAGWLGGTPL